jgi:hypothetical protein
MRKRKRHDDDEDGDIDMDAKGGDDGWEDDEMDVDEEDTPNRKRAKKNDGAVSVAAVGARGPRTDRRFAGMRDQGVRLYAEVDHPLLIYIPLCFSKQIVLSSYAILGSGLAICWPRLEKPIVILGQKW